MTVSITQATRIAGTSDGAVGATTTTASFSWAANELLIMSVASGDTGGAPAAPSSITGGTSGLTFTLIDSQTAGNVCVSVWRALSASSGSGTTVITWAAGTDSGIHELEGFGGTLGGGTNGSGSILQTVKTNAGSQTAMTMSFAGTPTTTSLILAACNHNDTAGTMTAGTNFVGVSDNTQGTPSQHLYVEENPNGSAVAAVTLTSTVAGNFGFVGIEIGASTGPTGVGAIASAEAFGSPQIDGDMSGVGGIASAEAFGSPTIGLAGGPWPEFIIEVAFPNTALDLDANIIWTDITNYLRSFAISRSRSRELAQFDPGTLNLLLDNLDGSFSPENTGSQFFPYIRPNKRIRVKMKHGLLTSQLINAYANSWSERFTKPRDAVVAVSATDAFKLLAQYQIPDNWQLAVTALTPSSWYRLNERNGTTFYDSGPQVKNATLTLPASLDQAPLVPGADANVSRAVAFSGAGEATVSSPGVIPVSTTTTSIAYRSSSKAYNLNAPSSLTVTKPTGVIQNDVLLAGVEIRGDKSVTGVPSGWTLITSNNTGTSNSDAFLLTYWKLAGVSEPSTYKWTFSSGGDAAIVIAAFSGCNTTTPIDVSGSSQQTNANVTVPSITASSTNEMLVAFLGHNPHDASTSATYSTAVMGASTGGTVTEAADTNSQNNSGSGANRASVAVDYQSWPTAIATNSRTAALSGGSKPNVGIGILLKPAAGGVGAVPTPFTVAFWMTQTANQVSNADVYWKQGTQAAVYQDLATGRTGVTIGGLSTFMGTNVVPLNTPSLIIFRYDGNLGVKMNTSYGVAATGGPGGVVTLTANAFEFGLADCTMDELTVWGRSLSDAEVATLIAIAGGTAKTTAVVDQALTAVKFPSDLRQIKPDLVSGQVVSNLATATNAGDKVLDYLRNVAVTERGVVYMTGDGKVAFETLNYLQTDASRITPVATFGQGVGEIGYMDLTPDYSDQILVNDVEITNTTTDYGGTRGAAYSEKYSLLDTTSSGEFSTYTLALNTNYDDTLANRQAAINSRMAFEIARYSQPQRRIFSIQIDGTPTAVDWDTLLALTMLNRVTVNHVTPWGATISKDYTIRQLDWSYTVSPKAISMTIGLDEGAI